VSVPLNWSIVSCNGSDDTYMQGNFVLILKVLKKMRGTILYRNNFLKLAMIGVGHSGFTKSLK
jgi:hypothetical protein